MSRTPAIRHVKNKKSHNGGWLGHKVQEGTSKDEAAEEVCETL